MTTAISTKVGTSVPTVVTPPLSKAEAEEVCVRTLIEQVGEPWAKAIAEEDAAQKRLDALSEELGQSLEVSNIAKAVLGVAVAAEVSLSHYTYADSVVCFRAEHPEHPERTVEWTEPLRAYKRLKKANEAHEAADKAEHSARSELRSWVARSLDKCVSQVFKHGGYPSSVEELYTHPEVLRAARKTIRSAVKAKTSDARVAAALKSESTKTWAQETLTLLGVSSKVSEDQP